MSIKQYTLIYILDKKSKVVHMKTFLTLSALKDFKNFYLNNKLSLSQVDSDGYVWFTEVN